MAVAAFGTNDAETVKLWEKAFFLEAAKDTEIRPLVGTGVNACIRKSVKLAKEKGDRVRVHFVGQLTGLGVTENEALRGNEESMETHTDDLVINELWHGVGWHGEGTISDKRTLVDFRMHARRELGRWFGTRTSVAFHLHAAGYKGTSVTVEGASYTVDGKLTGFNTVDAADSAHIFRPNSKTTDEGIASTDPISLALIDQVVTVAKLSNPKVKPFRVNGSNKYVMYLHPDQIYELRTNTDTGNWQDFAKYAVPRDRSAEMIYQGAIGEYNGVVFREAEHVSPGYNSTTFAEIATVRRAVLLGAGSAHICYSQRDEGSFPTMWREETDDFKRQNFIAGGMIWGLKKTRFDSKDYGTIVVPTYAAHT